MDFFVRKQLISAMLVFFALLFPLALPAAEQYNKNFSFELRDVTVKDIFRYIEQNSEYVFLYASNKNLSKKVNVDVKNKNVKQILDEVLEHTGLVYEIDGKQILVKERKEAPVAETRQVEQNQGRDINGVVTDKNGEPIIGANVIVKGTSIGVTTDVDGQFHLKGVSKGSVLQISYIGFTTQEITVGLKNDFRVVLTEDTEMLGEVVVTALGIKREEKALGYAVQKVKGDALSTVKAVDVGTALTGKVAGLNVKNSTEFNSAPTIEIRGESPLIVIDGVPYGNINMRDINSDDIESLDVLKGATASALYGARGGNGVIMITTKKANKEGLDISINSSTMFNAGYLAIPEAQHSYSSGTGGKYDSKDYVWGDKLDIGRTAVQYNPFTYQWEEQPLVSKGKDNFRNFLEQGFSTNNNISIAWKGKNGGFRTSLNHVYIHRKLDIVDMQTVMESGIMVVDRIPKGTQQVYF